MQKAAHSLMLEGREMGHQPATRAGGTGGAWDLVSYIPVCGRARGSVHKCVGPGGEGGVVGARH